MVSGKYAADFDVNTNIKERLFASLNDPDLISGESGHSAGRVYLLRTVWFRYAAAVILVLSLGTIAYFWTINKKTQQTLAGNSRQLKTDIAPGSEKAVLTLADGRTITLNNAANGQLAVQQGSKVVKKDGQVIYNSKDISATNVAYNTMSTPRGGQYKLTLPDGTNVWLNAATSITYPIAFTGKERKVKISGEAYFEVTKNKEKPFIVDIDGKSTVEVLGTHFNINSYENENAIKTTLIEGSVKVAGANHNAILKPGQQAQLNVGSVASSNQQLEIVNADIDQTLAWKNDLFSFNDADLPAVMRQLERWYDIKVRYEGKVTDFSLKGEMYRNVNLSVVLNFLQKTGVKFRMEGRTLIVAG